MIEGTPAITITLWIQKPGAPDTLLRMKIRAFGDTRHAQARLVHLGAGLVDPFVQDGERARIGVDRHAECLPHAVGGNVAVGRPIPPVVKT